MFNRFTGEARRVVRCAEREARELGSPTSRPSTCSSR